MLYNVQCTHCTVQCWVFLLHCRMSSATLTHGCTAAQMYQVVLDVGHCQGGDAVWRKKLCFQLAVNSGVHSCRQKVKTFSFKVNLVAGFHNSSLTFLTLMTGHWRPVLQSKIDFILLANGQAEYIKGISTENFLHLLVFHNRSHLLSRSQEEDVYLSWS